jgi:hypothetical protein
MPVEHAAPWILDGKLARLNCGGLRAEIDVNRSAGGIRCVTCHDVPLAPLELFQVVPPSDTDGGETLTEHYVRGGDLIASYASAPTAAVSRQLYWRALSAADSPKCGVELWVSSQTSRLTSDPRTACFSRLPRGDTLRLIDPDAGTFSNLPLAPGDSSEVSGDTGSGAFLLRPPSAACSLAVMVHPADFTRAALTAKEGELQLEVPLFEMEQLEKGVIRRARLQCLFVAREEDERGVCDSYRDFASSELPLTA